MMLLRCCVLGELQTNDARNNKADEARYFQTVEYERGKENDEQNQGKLQYRIAQGQRYVEKSRKQHRPTSKKFITTPVIKKRYGLQPVWKYAHLFACWQPRTTGRKTGSCSSGEFVY